MLLLPPSVLKFPFRISWIPIYQANEPLNHRITNLRQDPLYPNPHNNEALQHSKSPWHPLPSIKPTSISQAQVPYLSAVLALAASASSYGNGLLRYYKLANCIESPSLIGDDIAPLRQDECENIETTFLSFKGSIPEACPAGRTPSISVYARDLCIGDKVSAGPLPLGGGDGACVNILLESFGLGGRSARLTCV